MGLIFGVFGAAIFLMMEVADGKQMHPLVGIWRMTVDEHEWRHQLVVYLAWDQVHHASSVLNRKELEVTRHLFVSQKRTRHIYHCLPMPMAFD